MIVDFDRNCQCNHGSLNVTVKGIIPLYKYKTLLIQNNRETHEHTLKYLKEKKSSNCVKCLSKFQFVFQSRFLCVPTY